MSADHTELLASLDALREVLSWGGVASCPRATSSAAMLLPAPFWRLIVLRCVS